MGIGASAGGLDSFKCFFHAMPADSGMAFIFAPHLDPCHESPMVELLAEYTVMKVIEVVDGQMIQPNQVYVIPPNQILTMTYGRLTLSQLEDSNKKQMAIDLFLLSLAAACQESAVGILFSGVGAQGTLGLNDFRVRGGLTQVEKPTSAGFEQMSRSAISAGVADYVPPPDAMPGPLTRKLCR